MPVSKHRRNGKRRPRGRDQNPLGPLDGTRIRLTCCCRPVLVLAPHQIKAEHRTDCPAVADPASDAGNAAREACGRETVAELDRLGIRAMSIVERAPGSVTVAMPRSPR